MNHADEYSAYIVRYLENQLNDAELESFGIHLVGCIRCRENLEQERALSRLLHCSKPLYKAPPELRAWVSRTAQPAAPDPVRGRGWLRICSYVVQLPVRCKLLVPTAVVVMILGIALGPDVIQNVRAMDYIETAVATHRNFLNGSIPLQVRSGSTMEVRGWFEEKLPFHFRLPGAEAFDDSKVVYRLTGAGLVTYKGGRIAWLTYEALQEKISLVVAPEEYATIGGGDKVHCGGLTFHYNQRDAFKVITWSNHGLAYALVSSRSVSSRQPCLVCHQTMTDRDSFGQLQ
jgi:anti-sigma factor RsiW